MNLLISSNHNPYWNLATEEFLLKNSSEDFIFLYINQPSVVIGKHQIAPKEINSEFIFDNKILIARRLTGGGTVYHDEGNLNFSFIQSVPPGENISYRIITQPILSFLNQIGINAQLSERNDLVVSENKISGNAMHVFKNRVLVHCTLLINCNLKNLSAALSGNPARFTDRSIPSQRSEVINLNSLNGSMKIENILMNFSDFIRKEKMVTSSFHFTSETHNSIHNLAKEKYSSFDWIYGYSPKYSYTNYIEIEGGKKLECTLEVEKGVICSILVKQKDKIDEDKFFYLNNLKGMNHNIFSYHEWADKYLFRDPNANFLKFLF